MADKRSAGGNNEEKELAQIARKEFEAKNFSACMDKLKSLSSLLQNNPKIQHNMCVCHFHQSGFQHVENLKKGLKQVCNLVQVDPDNAPSVEDTDHAVLFFNQAVILYHQRQHNQAIKILEKLFQVIEPLEDKLAVQVLLLLAEACLCTQQPDKALRPLSYIDKQITSSKQGGGEKSEGKENKDNETDFVSLCEKNKAKIHQLKTKCYLQLKHMRFCKRELKSVMTSSSNGHPSAALFLKSNFEYERGNFRKAIKLLTGAQHDSDPWQTGESVPVMYYNNLGCVHFYMGKYHLACHYAKKALMENTEAVQLLVKKSSQRRTSRPLHTMGFSRHYELLYNAGIQLLHAGRPLAAFDCLIETVQVYSTNPRLWLRLAECCIAVNKGTPGPESVSKGLPDANRHGIVKSIIGSGQHKRVIIAPGVTEKKYSNEVKSAAIPVASLEFGSLCLCNALSLLPSKVTLPTDCGSSSSSIPSDPGDVTDNSSTFSSAKVPLICNSAALPGPPLKSHEILNLRCSVLACSAYVSLVLGDNVVALQHAKDLLAIPGLAGSLKFLGHLYAAEALVHLNRIGDAIQYLSVDSAQDVSVVYPGSPEQDKDKDKVDKGETAGGDGNDTQEVQGSRVRQTHPASSEYAKATVCINLASLFALRSEWDNARQCLRKACKILTNHEIPQEALFLAIYVELQNGNIPLALEMIKTQQIITATTKDMQQWNNSQHTNISSPSTIMAPWPDNSPWQN